MKIALISDLHANLVALEAVLTDIHSAQVDQIICLGDIAALGPQPCEVVAIVRSLGCMSVQGNHDPFSHSLPILRELEEWTLARLQPDATEFLRSLPLKVEVQMGDLKLLCVHGSPRSFNDMILANTDEKRLDAFFCDQNFDVLVCGHTHVQFFRRLQGKSLVGVGSVGVPFFAPFDGTSPPKILKCCEYAILEYEQGKLTVDLRQLPYDFEMYKKSVIKSKMPYQDWWCNQWI